MINDTSSREKLCHIINSAVSNYERKKAESEKCIKVFQEKIEKGKNLSLQEESEKYDAELYLAELDMDTMSRANLINSRTSKKLEEMISLAREIVNKHNK